MNDREERFRRVLKELKALDLSLYPSDEIISLFKQLDNLPVLITTLLPGRRIIRGRSYNEGEDFSLIDYHSYRPKEMNDEYQRASIPKQTMFYGAVTSGEQEEPVARVTILTEIGKTMNQDAEYEKVMFSAWEVIEDINLISVMQCQFYQSPNKMMQTLEKRFNDELKYDYEREFWNFIATEFAKKNTSLDYDYIISAYFSTMACNACDGVYYPSVRIDGAGMNVAIKPEVIDSKLRFLGAVDCDVVRTGMDIQVLEKRKSIFKLEYIPIVNE